MFFNNSNRSRSFGSILDSTMSSQQGKDTALAYLKVVIHLLNENMDELDFKLGRPLRLDDLNHLTSDQMLKIVTFLLRDVVGDKPVCKIHFFQIHIFVTVT